MAKINNLQQHIHAWTEENKPLGQECGYPDCCIQEFCNQPPVLMKYSKPSKDDKRRYKAGCINGKFTGFIPCIEHANQIFAGKITLADLITNRSDSLVDFPNA